jgi:hypothetical protein
VRSSTKLILALTLCVGAAGIAVIAWPRDASQPDDATIEQPQHDTAAPNRPIQVSAEVVGTSDVTLVYRTGFGPEASIAMQRDSGDRFVASIPGQKIGTLVRYRIEAGSARYPPPDDPGNYSGTVVLDPDLATDLPVFHWFIDRVAYEASLSHRFTNDTEPAVFFFDGRLWSDIRVRVRGRGARRYPKNHWKLIFPSGDEFVAPSLGIDTAMDRFNLQASADKSYLREILSWQTFEAAGVPSLRAFHVRLHVNGAFFGLYTFLEQPDGEWLDRVGLDRKAARYKAVGDRNGDVDASCSADTPANLVTAYEKKSRKSEDYSDLDELLTNIATLEGKARRDYIFDNVDIPAQLNYQAALVLMHDNDSTHKNYYLYRDTEGTGRWRMLPWDKDLTWGRNFVDSVLNEDLWADTDGFADRPNVAPSHPLFGDSNHQKYDSKWNRCIDALYADPEILQMFFRRLRTLMDQQLAAPVLERRIEQLVSRIGAESGGNEAALDADKWGQYGDRQSLPEAVGLIAKDYLVARRRHLFHTHRIAGEIPERQSARPEIEIARATPLFVELSNPSDIEAVDVSGWQVADTTIPPGTVLLPHSSVFLAADDRAFREERSGRFVAAELSGALPPKGTLVLVDPDGVEIDRTDYPNP